MPTSKKPKKTWIVVGGNRGNYTVSFGQRVEPFDTFVEAVDYANAYQTVIKYEPHLVNQLFALGGGSVTDPLKKKSFRAKDDGELETMGARWYRESGYNKQYRERRKAEGRPLPSGARQGSKKTQQYNAEYYAATKEDPDRLARRRELARIRRREAYYRERGREVPETMKAYELKRIWCNAKEGQVHQWQFRKYGSPMFGLALYVCRRCGMRDIRQKENCAK